jgi:hypothetical protein
MALLVDGTDGGTIVLGHRADRHRPGVLDNRSGRRLGVWHRSSMTDERVGSSTQRDR